MSFPDLFGAFDHQRSDAFDRQRSGALDSRKSAPPLELVLYTRAGCHLCDAMKAEIERAGLEELYRWREIDIDSDPALADRYGLSIPVLELDGHALFKGRCTAGEFRRKLERALREMPPS